MVSLYTACKQIYREKTSGTKRIGEVDIPIEYYTQADIIAKTSLGNTNQNNIVAIIDENITIPSGQTVTTANPKKSLVFYCRNFVNNGTVSMYQKAPNVLPHDYFIIEGNFVGTSNIIIPAYANNKKTDTNATGSATVDNTTKATKNGNNGSNRNCGSGGLGMSSHWMGVNNYSAGYGATSGSGYAFGGGAGSGAAVGESKGQFASNCSVNATYPMRGGNGARSNYASWNILGGVGNPVGTTTAPNAYTNNTGCGGRIIIFCENFTNNGTINVNGTATYQTNQLSTMIGGASGAGAVDIFYTNLVKQGTITANGGAGKLHSDITTIAGYAGAGGNGSITLTPWAKKVFKEERKIFTKDNWIYLFTNYSERLREDVI